MVTNYTCSVSPTVRPMTHSTHTLSGYSSRIKLFSYLFKHEHSESADLCQAESGRDPDLVTRVRIYIPIRTSDPGDFQNFAGTSLFKVTFVIKFLERFYQFIGDMSQLVAKCPISQCWRLLQKIPGSRSGSRLLPKFNQFFHVCRYICSKIFRKIYSVVFM